MGLKSLSTTGFRGSEQAHCSDCVFEAFSEATQHSYRWLCFGSFAHVGGSLLLVANNLILTCDEVLGGKMQHQQLTSKMHGLTMAGLQCPRAEVAKQYAGQKIAHLHWTRGGQQYGGDYVPTITGTQLSRIEYWQEVSFTECFDKRCVYTNR